MGRIDVHQHVVPPIYRANLDSTGQSAGGWPTPDWSPAAAVAMMDDEGIATGILSLSAPGARLSDDNSAGRQLARKVNEYTAELVKNRPDRFGNFATLPLPDVDGALTEAAYAFDELHADGVVLLSSAHGRYLGDAAYEPLWAELNRRRAVVFVHPTEPPLAMLPGLPGPILDYPFDTTRTALHLVVNGVMSRHRDVKIILSHAGGFVPFAAYRFVGAAQFTDGLTPDGILNDLRRFWFDTALSATPSSLPSLLAFAAPGHILYGSDFPFAPQQVGHQMGRQLDTYDMPAGVRHGIDRDNAVALFPRLDDVQMRAVETSS